MWKLCVLLDWKKDEGESFNGDTFVSSAPTAVSFQLSVFVVERTPSCHWLCSRYNFVYQERNLCTSPRVQGHKKDMLSGLKSPTFNANSGGWHWKMLMGALKVLWQKQTLEIYKVCFVNAWGWVWLIQKRSNPWFTTNACVLQQGVVW